MATPDKLLEATSIIDELGEVSDTQLALLEGLTDQQQVITRFKMRGISQKQIAKFLGLTKGRVSQEVRAIREYNEARGVQVDASAVVGETVCVYEEVERKAWEVFYGDDSKQKLRALETVMSAREKQMKLYMDLGFVKRAAIEHSHDYAPSPLMSSLTDERRDEIVARIIATSPGVDPTPPELEAS